MKVTKKPVQVDAWPIDLVAAWIDRGVRFPGVPEFPEPELVAAVNEGILASADDGGALVIRTMEGPITVSTGWLIRGAVGEFYRCDSDVFDRTYDIGGRT